MRLLVIGRGGTVSARLAEQTVRELLPDYLVVLTRTGLAVTAMAVAEKIGIPVVRYRPDFLVHGSFAMEMAIRQMTASEGSRVTCVCIRPRPTDWPVIKLLNRFGHDVVVGKLSTCSSVSWHRVPRGQLDCRSDSEKQAEAEAPPSGWS